MPARCSIASLADSFWRRISICRSNVARLSMRGVNIRAFMRPYAVRDFPSLLVYAQEGPIPPAVRLDPIGPSSESVSPERCLPPCGAKSRVPNLALLLGGSAWHLDFYH